MYGTFYKKGIKFKKKKLKRTELNWAHYQRPKASNFAAFSGLIFMLQFLWHFAETADSCDPSLPTPLTTVSDVALLQPTACMPYDIWEVPDCRFVRF